MVLSEGPLTEGKFTDFVNSTDLDREIEGEIC